MVLSDHIIDISRHCIHICYRSSSAHNLSKMLRHNNERQRLSFWCSGRLMKLRAGRRRVRKVRQLQMETVKGYGVLLVSSILFEGQDIALSHITYRSENVFKADGV